MHLSSCLTFLTFFLAASTASAYPSPALEDRDTLERRDVPLSGCGDIIVSQVSGSTSTVNGCLDINGNWVTDGACARYFVYSNATGNHAFSPVSLGTFAVSPLYLFIVFLKRLPGVG